MNNNKFGTKDQNLPKQQANNRAINKLKEPVMYSKDMTEVVMNPPYCGTQWAKEFANMKNNKSVSKIICIHPSTQIENFYTDERQEIQDYLNDGVVDIVSLPWSVFPDTNSMGGDIVVSYWERDKQRSNPLQIKDRYDLRFICKDKDLYRTLETIIPNFKLNSNSTLKLKHYDWNKLPDNWLFPCSITAPGRPAIGDAHAVIYHYIDQVFVDRAKSNDLFKWKSEGLDVITGDYDELKAFFDFWRSDLGIVIKTLYSHDQHMYWNKIPKFDYLQDFSKFIYNLNSRIKDEAQWIHYDYNKFLEMQKGLKVQDYNHLSKDLKKQLGSVYTPEDFSKFMTLVITALQVDPQCGTGNLLKMVLQYKLDNGMSELEALKTIRGTDIEQQSVLKCRKNILKFLKLEYNTEAIEYVNKYIVCSDSKCWNYDEWKPAGLCEFLDGNTEQTINKFNSTPSSTTNSCNNIENFLI